MKSSRKRHAWSRATGLVLTLVVAKAAGAGAALATQLPDPGQTAEALELDFGYLSPCVITESRRGQLVLDNPLVLIHEKKITSVQDLAPVVEEVARAGRPLLIVAEDIEGEAFATLVVNKLRGGKAVAVKVPCSEERRRDTLRRIAEFTGGRPVTEDSGTRLENIRLEDLGQARKITIGSDNTTIEGGSKQARAQPENTICARLEAVLEEQFGALESREESENKQIFGTVVSCTYTLTKGRLEGGWTSKAATALKKLGVDAQAGRLEVRAKQQTIDGRRFATLQITSSRGTDEPDVMAVTILLTP